ncbi:unnamed protein product, partial [Rotaria sp. Silwood2]
IDNLIHQLITFKRSNDQRTIMNNIKELSKKYKFEVGRKSMKILANILHGTADTHLIQVTLETLITLVIHDITTDKEQLDLPQDILVELTGRISL